MKKVAGTLKLDQAQYRELEAFSKFGAEVDAATKIVLDKGAKNVEILKQGRYSPLKVEQQIAIIYCGTNGLLADVPLDKVGEFEKNFLEIIENKHKETVLEPLKNGQLTDEIESILRSEAAALSAGYKNN
jgi:F-type H+-transporting ATPase subunit alpha